MVIAAGFRHDQGVSSDWEEMDGVLEQRRQPETRADAAWNPSAMSQNDCLLG